MPGEEGMSPRRDIPAKDLRCYGREGAVQAPVPSSGQAFARGKVVLTRLETGFVASPGECGPVWSRSGCVHSMHNWNWGQEAVSAFAHAKEAAGSAVWDGPSQCPSGPWGGQIGQRR